MNLLIEMFVPGVPRTKGSLDVVNAMRGRGVKPVLADSDLSVRWRRLVAYKARAAYAGREPSSLPIYVEGVFTLPGVDTPAILAQGAGDVDKLVRNVLDALALDPKKPDLAAGVYVNDSQVVAINVAKQPSRAQLPYGLNVKVWEIPL